MPQEWNVGKRALHIVVPQNFEVRWACGERVDEDCEENDDSDGGCFSGSL